MGRVAADEARIAGRARTHRWWGLAREGARLQGGTVYLVCGKRGDRARLMYLDLT